MAKTVDGEAFEAWVEVVTEEHHKEKGYVHQKSTGKAEETENLRQPAAFDNTQEYCKT